MVEFTLVEVNLDEGSFNLPFSGSTGASDLSSSAEDDDGGIGAEDEESGGSGKGAAALGVLFLLILGAVAVRYLSGDDDQDVAIETADDGPVGVSVDAEDK